MTPGRARRVAAVLLATLALPALAHHGSAAVGALGVEGPGVALDTTSPFPLGQGTLFLLAKSEYADFMQRPAGWPDPQKQFSSFNTLALGYGITPWLSAFVFQPYNLKSIDPGGTNTGIGDTNLMLSAAFKWDEGLRLVPAKESLDELADWHFSLWVACTLPVGSTDHRDDLGGYYEPDTQIGFGGPSPSFGLAATRQLAADFTTLLEVTYQKFYTQSYPGPGLTYRFGAEARANAALSWRAWHGGTSRLDVVPEVSLLKLQRDQEDGAALAATGGTVLYGQLGARLALGALSIGASVKVPVARNLNEEAQQQGSEGLENFRAALVVGWSTRL